MPYPVKLLTLNVSVCWRHAPLMGFSPEADWSEIVNAEVEVFGLDLRKQRSCVFNVMLLYVAVQSPHAFRTQAEHTHNYITGSD